jgi:hypothetical protein
VAAAASLLRGKHYVHEVHAAEAAMRESQEVPAIR